MKRFWIVFIIFQFFVIKSKCANILCLMTLGSPSHHIWNRAIINRIASEGHNVTVLSGDIEKVVPNNIHYIHLDKIYSVMYNGTEKLNLMDLVNENAIETVLSFLDFGYLMCRGIFESKGFKILLDYPKEFKFDLVIYDFTCGPCALGFLEKFNYPPVIGVSAFNNPTTTHHIIGGHKYYAYVPFYSLNYDEKMNFFQRSYNTFIYMLDESLRKYIFLPRIDKQMREAFGYKNLPYVSDLEKLTKILLVNSHPSIDIPEPSPPNLILVGGLQISEPKPLPNDLLEFIKRSKKGTVLLSLGTNIRSEDLDDETQENILQAFKEIPDYNFIWKFESDKLSKRTPKNVLIKAWMPQSDLLANNEIVLFITHAGLLSMQESIWYAKPMIAIPFLCDQYRNSYILVRNGLGERLNIFDLTKNSLKTTILKVLNNPMYKSNINEKSKNFRDQPQKPIELAHWWIEWVLRNPNTTYLQSPTINMNFIVSNVYDVLIFFIFLLICFILLIQRLVYRVVSWWSNRKIKNDNIKKNK